MPREGEKREDSFVRHYLDARGQEAWVPVPTLWPTPLYVVGPASSTPSLGV